MSHDVFISYADEDKPIADAACAKLESEGIRCWIASRDAVPGKPWSDAIIRAITESQVMVLIFSSSANKSVHVTREVNHAIDKGLPLIPFRIENVEPTGSLEFYLDVTHWLDAIDPPLENQLRRLAETIKRLLKEPVNPPFRSPAPAPHKAASLWIWCGAGLLAIILMIFVVRYIRPGNLVVTNTPTPTPPIYSSAASTLTPVPKTTSSNSPVKIEPNSPTPLRSPTSEAKQPPDDTENRIVEAFKELEGLNTSVSVNAITKLETIAKTSKERSWRIVETLTAYIRRKARWQEGTNRKQFPEELKAALKFLGRREWHYKNGEPDRLDLRNLDLRGARFAVEGQRANFKWVRLNGSHLEDAVMSESDFQCADLSGAHMDGADVWNTDFYGAELLTIKVVRVTKDPFAGALNRNTPRCTN